MTGVLLDTNVLVHATYRRSVMHEPARELLERALRRRGLFCVAPQNLVEFAAVVTRGHSSDPPLDPAGAAERVRILYRSRRLLKIYPRRATVLRTAQEGAALKIRGSLWYDLFLAVTMREAGVRVIVTENIADFRRIPFVHSMTIRDAVEDAGAV